MIKTLDMLLPHIILFIMMTFADVLGYTPNHIQPSYAVPLEELSGDGTDGAPFHHSHDHSYGMPLNHSHFTILDPERVMMVSWTPNLQEQEVVWTLEARTLGWLGFGVSSNGGMDGADMVTAWVTDGKLFLQDRHGVGHKLPPLDDVGNWRPIAAGENGTHTSLTVARRFDTCDEQDFPITNETTRFIFAWGPADPPEGKLPYHGPRRGAKFALALLPPHHPSPALSGYSTWHVNQSISLPHAQDTFYWCHVEKVPPGQHKRHYIGFSMVYGANSREHLHHSVAFECRSLKEGTSSEDVFEQWVGHQGFECYTPSMPESFNWCEKFFINWATGSEGELLPDTVGVPMGERHGGPTYLLFQTHYDNFRLKKNITVSWGMDIYYTDVLRPHDAGNIGLGHAINFGLTVPPGAEYWRTTGHCSSHCTAEALPKEGVKVFMVFLHAHYLARAIRLRHYRGGRELPLVVQDRHYDADFQQARRLTEELLLLPGDSLTVECDYDSRNRVNGTFSGWKTMDEMCHAFITYHPRVELALCRSTPTVGTLRKALGIEDIPNDLDLSAYIFDPELSDGRSYQSVVNGLDWPSLDTAAISRQISSGEHFIKCQYNSRVLMKLPVNTTRYPDAVPYRPSLTDNSCKNTADPPVTEASDHQTSNSEPIHSCSVTIIPCLVSFVMLSLRV